MSSALKAKQKAGEINQPVESDSRFQVLLDLQNSHRRPKQQAGSKQYGQAYQGIFQEQIWQVIKTVRDDGQHQRGKGC
jgi:hypothetical protein